MASPVIDKLDKESMREDVPRIHIGDSVRVHTRIYEGEKERIQIFAGRVIAMDGGCSTEMFTVRRISHGVGVEKVFPVHSPHIAQIEIEGSFHVRRAKLYFLRKLRGRKATRLKEKLRR